MQQPRSTQSTCSSDEKKDITIEDTISIPKSWVPTIIGTLTRFRDMDADIIVRGLQMRLSDAPLVALPVIDRDNK